MQSVSSQQSHVSKRSFKYQVEAVEEDDKDIHSQFDSSSSSEESKDSADNGRSSSSGSGDASEEYDNDPDENFGNLQVRGRRQSRDDSELINRSSLQRKKARKTATAIAPQANRLSLPGKGAGEKRRHSDRNSDQSVNSSRLSRGRSISISANNAKKGKFTASGWVEKRATATFMGVANWQRRFALLEDQRLYLFEGETPKEMESARKSIDLAKVQCVCFHYDEQAPVKSNRLDNKGVDNSRFDVYTLGRIYHLRSEKTDEFNSEEWVAILQKAAAHYNPKYNRAFLG